MSVSLNSSVALSLLSGLAGNGGTPDLVSIASGLNGAGGGTDPIAALTQAEANQAKDIALQKKDPTTAAEIKRFLAVVATAPDLKTLLADPTARKVFLTANGLGSHTDYPALATKALSSSPTDSKSLAAKLGNAAWQATVKTYDFADKGLSLLKKQSVLDSITNGYAQVVWGENQDQTTPGLAAALDFRSRAPTIAKVDDILGDANFRKVVTVALGIPQQIAFQPLLTQEKAITDRLDLKKLKDPKFVENLARQFLIQNQTTSSTASAGGSSLTSLFA